ncbi:hypothetical protein D9M71_611810 [compost metagenome]
MHTVLHFAACGEHQHRHGLATFAQARQHLETIHARQADIEDRQGVFLASQGQVGGYPITQQVHCPTGAFQRLGDAVA